MSRLEPCEKRVVCPRCLAQPGYACRGGGGRILVEPHGARIRADRDTDRVPS